MLRFLFLTKSDEACLKTRLHDDKDEESDQRNVNKQEKSKYNNLSLAKHTTGFGAWYIICETKEQHDDTPADALVENGHSCHLKIAHRTPHQQNCQLT